MFPALWLIKVAGAYLDKVMVVCAREDTDFCRRIRVVLDVVDVHGHVCDGCPLGKLDVDYMGQGPVTLPELVQVGVSELRDAMAGLL